VRAIRTLNSLVPVTFKELADGVGHSFFFVECDDCETTLGGALPSQPYFAAFLPNIPDVNDESYTDEMGAFQDSAGFTNLTIGAVYDPNFINADSAEVLDEFLPENIEVAGQVLPKATQVDGDTSGNVYVSQMEYFLFDGTPEYINLNSGYWYFTTAGTHGDYARTSNSTFQIWDTRYSCEEC